MIPLLALDPGSRHMGAAWFIEGELRTAVHIQPDKDSRNDQMRTWVHLGEKLNTWVEPLLYAALDGLHTFDFAYEMMVERKRSNKPTKDLFEICGVLGACGSELWWSNMHRYEPSQWNKSRKKPPNHLRIWSRLSPVERANFCEETKHTPTTFEALIAVEVDTEGKRTLGQLEHPLEAVGIGLHHLGRLNDVR